MYSYFISATYPRTTAFILAQLPEAFRNRMEGLREDMKGSFIGFLRAQALLIMLTFFQLVLAFLVEAYDEEVVDAEKNDVRVVMHFHPALAPFKAAVLPLSKKLADKGREIQTELSKYFMVDYDDAGSIGKRYRRQDEIGTPYCITVDFDTVGDAEKAGDNAVTIRDRDTMEQVRVPIDQLKSWLEEKLAY